MAGSAHTPGPWLVEKDRATGEYVIWVREPHSGQIATVHTEDVNGEFPAEANARVMGAGPALLVALKALLSSHYPDDSGFWEWLSIQPQGDQETHTAAVARAAIALAEGAS